MKVEKKASDCFFRLPLVGSGESRTPVRVRKSSTSTGLSVRGICRAKVAAPKASPPYSGKSPARSPESTHSKPWLVTEIPDAQSGAPEFPAVATYAARANCSSFSK